MKKLKYFLVSIDVSPFSNAAMHYAVYLAKHTDAQIKALHVVDIVIVELASLKLYLVAPQKV